jgi:ABC-type glycerol-3-phosphate transport system substrate-binding protein
MTNYRHWGHLITAITIGAIVLSLGGCQLPGTVSETGLATPPVIVTTAPVEIPTVGAPPTISVTTTPPTPTLTLTLWTIESISPEAQGEAGDFISSSLRAFKLFNPNVNIEIILKKPGGKGGMLDFLRTTRNVAPTILPDVAVLNATDLGQAYTEGLIWPLDDRLSRALVQDLIPAARKMGTVDNKLVGVPLGLDIEHTVYNTRTFTAPLVLWSDVLSRPAKYLFPAKGVNGLVNDTSLSFYFSAGGKLHNDEGKPQLDERILRNLLDFYQQAVAAKVIDPAALNAASTEDLWPTYLAAKAGLAQISMRQYLTDRDRLKNTSFAPLPVFKSGDPPVLITHGWALVLVTTDPQRQQEALNLIETFMSTENNITWNTINKSIPTRETAYKKIAAADPYWDFVAEQLKTAQPQPGFTRYDQIGRILQQAVQQVINGEAAPDKATATAIDALTP